MKLNLLITQCNNIIKILSWSTSTNWHGWCKEMKEEKARGAERKRGEKKEIKKKKRIRDKFHVKLNNKIRN